MHPEISWSAQPELSLHTRICRSDGELAPDDAGRIGNRAPNRRGQAFRMLKVKAWRIGRPTQLHLRTADATYPQQRLWHMEIVDVYIPVYVPNYPGQYNTVKWHVTHHTRKM